MKNSVSLKILHFINIIISVSLLALSIISLFYINKEVITYHEDLKDIVFLFRILISTIALVGVVAVLIGGLFPDDPYILNDKQKKGLRRFAIINLILNIFSKSTSTAATLVSYDAIVKTRFIRRIWNWVAAFIIFCFMAFLSWFLFGISVSDNSVNYTLIELINNSFSTSLYNKLVLGMLCGMILLSIFTMLWRIIADKQRKNDKNWRRQPIYTVIISIVIIILLVLISMYFHLTKIGIFVLVILVYVIGTFIENKIDPKSGNENRQGIFSNTPYDEETDQVKDSDSKELTFEERKNK